MIVTLACGSTTESTEPFTEPVIGWIEKPTTVAHYRVQPPSQPSNLPLYVPGYVENSEVILSNDLVYASDDLTGAALTIELYNQKATHYILHDPLFDEMFTHMSVLEFTFPEADYQGVIDWVAHLNLTCSYELTNYLDGGSYIWFDYVIVEDQNGTWSLDSMPQEVAITTLEPGAEGAQEYVIQGSPGGTLTTSDERRGQMPILPGVKPKLFIGVVVQLRAYVRDNRIQVGVKEPGVPPDYCTLEVKNSSTTGSIVWYGPEYTMAPLGSS